MTVIDNLSATRAAASYIPAILVDEIARGECNPQSREERLRGPVMFLDLAGFTPFVLSLCSQGQKGVETLRGILTQYFAGLVDCIYEHGGDVFHFAGDSMLVGFIKESSETDGDCAVRAAACATAIRSKMAKYEDFPSLGQNHRMRLKTGLGFGDYHYVLVGHEQFWFTPLILGKPIDAAIDAERHAQGGEILLDKEMWALLPAPKEGTPREAYMSLQSAIPSGPNRAGRDGQVGEVGNDDRLSYYAHYMEPVLFEKAVSSHPGFEGQFREVTCLFVRYSGFALRDDVDKTLVTLNEIYRFVQEMSKTHRAVINRVELGDKGFVFLFILGAPNAMENKGTVAGRLAMKLTQTPFSRLVTSQAGIATGYGYCGDVGAPYRKEYTVTGEVVNLAARLMSYAEAGGVYLDQSTQIRLDKRLITTEIPGVELKGIPGETTVFRLHSEWKRKKRTLTGHGGQLVGRTRELDVLGRFFREAVGGSSRVCLVTGDPGLGKSRLANDFLDQISPGEASVYSGSCYAHEQFTPYSAWKSILHQFLQVPDKSNPQEARGVILRQLVDIDRTTGEWAPVIAQILGIAAEEEAFTRNLEPAQKTRRVFQIVSQLIQRRAATETLLFCFDDVHWIDDASMKLIEYVAARLTASAVFFLLLGRDRLAGTLLASTPTFRLLPLTGLSRDDSRALLKVCMEQCEPDNNLEQMIFERAEGNPFFTESILQSLREQNLLRNDKLGRVTFSGDSSQLQIPETLQDLILTRVDRLDENEKTILRIASVVGRLIPREVLASLIPESIDSELFDSILARLEGIGFISTVAGDSERFMFKHVLISDVAYATLPLEIRESLHRRIGEYIEAALPADGEERVDLLSYHFLKGNVLDKGLGYAMRAGQRSAAKFAVRDAIYHYSTALGILELDEFRGRFDDRIRVNVELGDLFRQDGQYDRAMELLVACLEESLPPVHRADVHIRIGHVYQERGQAIQAIDELETGLSLLGFPVPHSGLQVRLAILWGLIRRAIVQTLPFPRGVSLAEERLVLEKQHEIMTHLGNIYWFSDIKRTAWTIVSTLNLSEKLQSPEKRSMAYGNFSLGLLSRGLKKRAWMYSERSLALARQANDPGVLSFVMNRVAVFGIYSNDPLESARKYQENITLLDQIGETWEKLTALGAAAAAYAMATELASTDEKFTELDALASELDSKMHLGWSRCWRPFYRYLRGLEEPESAKQTIRSSIPFSIECSDLGTQTLAQGHLCAIAVREGEGTGAAWLADKAYTSLWRHRGNTPLRTVQMAWVYAAEAAMHALESGVDGDARRRCHLIVKRGVSHAITVGKHFPYVLGPALRIKACYKAFRKGDKSAAAAFERAIHVLEASPDRWQTGIAYGEAAKHVPGRSREYAGEARAIFEEHGLKVEIERLERSA